MGEKRIFAVESVRILSRISQAQNERKPCTEWYREIPHQFCFLNLVRGRLGKLLLEGPGRYLGTLNSTAKV